MKSKLNVIALALVSFFITFLAVLAFDAIVSVSEIRCGQNAWTRAFASQVQACSRVTYSTVFGKLPCPFAMV